MTLTGLAPIGTSRTSRRSRLAFHWRAADLTLDPITGQAETYSRASASGSVPDRLGRMIAARVRDIPSFQMADLDSDLTYETPGLRLEGATTNVLLRSQEIANAAWSDVGTPATNVSTFLAPDGTLSAVAINDSDNAALEARAQAVTVAADTTTWTASVFVRQQASAATVLLRMRFSGGTAKDYRVALDPSDGTTSTTGSTDAPTRAGVWETVVAPDGVVWYRIYVTGANGGASDTTCTVTLYPAGSSALDASLDVEPTGINRFWGAQLENLTFPSSYVATTSTSVTRAVDSLVWEWNQVPQAMTVYTRHIERGTILSGTTLRLWHIGSSTATTDPRMTLINNGGNYGLFYDNGTTEVSSTLSSAPSAGQSVELRAVLGATAAVQLHQSINEATETSATASAANLPFGTAWADNELYLNAAGSSVGYNVFREVKIALGSRTLAEMRSLW